MWEGAGDRTELKYFDLHSYGRQRCLSRSPDAQPKALGSTLMGTGFLYCILSAPLDPDSIRAPRAPSVECGFPYHNSSISVSNSTATRTQLSCLVSWLSHILVQRPLDRPLDLWNRMFNRYQAEITVMQFRGHSLPMRQSMRVPWEFFSSSHFICQFLPTRFPLITAIEWHFGSGRKSKHNTRALERILKWFCIRTRRFRNQCRDHPCRLQHY